MGKTVRGGKGDGYDYFGKRAKSADCGYGPDVKRITNRLERKRRKAMLQKGKYEHLRDKEAF